jgi:hypothetical protein
MAWKRSKSKRIDTIVNVLQYSWFLPGFLSVFTLTTALSIRPPVITNIVFDSKTCAVQLVNFIKIPLVPLTLNISTWTVLHFKETDLDSRLLKVWWHEESWTIEGKR